MKKVFNIEDLDEELKTLKGREEILFYDRPMDNQKDRLEFQKYIYKLVTMSRKDEIEITGVISFKKKLKGGENEGIQNSKD